VSIDSLDSFATTFHRLADNIEKVIRGKRETVELALTCLFAEGHLLIEDVPGVGKTSLARCLAASVDVPMNRIQFTPDLLPTDVTGVTVYTPNSGEFYFRPGPVFANVVLADEINRASPKTQSALLEVMEERRVTFDGNTYELDCPFIVVATQNPIEQQGTYPLPEAQLDRFLMRISMDYPDYASEIEIMRADVRGGRAADVKPVLGAADVTDMADVARREVRVTDRIYDYILQLTHGTRALAQPIGNGLVDRPPVGTTTATTPASATGSTTPASATGTAAPGSPAVTSRPLRLGASPRGSLALSRAARVRAAADGRDYVTSDDVRGIAVAVLAHRLVLATGAELTGMTTARVVEQVIAGTRSPDRPHPRFT
jgi:MoxR-like ATPase